MTEQASAHENKSAHLALLLEKTEETTREFGVGFEHYSQKFNQLNKRMAEGRFHLAVLGQFKRGKSTLLNALIGDKILPMGVVPLTAIPTYIYYGEKPEISVTFCGGKPDESLKGGSANEWGVFLSRFVTEEGNPRNSFGVAEVQMNLPADILSSGVVLIDTPGIGSTYRHNTLATINFLQQCDAALFIVSADPPITEVELEFLRQVREKVPRIFFVMNKIDYLDDQDLDKALGFYKKVLGEQAGWRDDFPVFCVSARYGLNAKTSKDYRQWVSSGMEKLESFLVDFLVKEKRNALMDAVSRRAIDFADAVLMEAGISVNALNLPLTELEGKIALFSESLIQAERERTLIQDVLEGDKKRVSLFMEEQAALLREESKIMLKEIMNGGNGLRSFGASSTNDFEKSWAERIPAFFQEQQTMLNERVKMRLVDCLTPHEHRLDNLIETLRKTAASLFQTPYHRPLGEDEVFEVKRKPYWVLNTWNADALPMLKSSEQRLEELALRNVENIRWAMLQNLNLSFAKFASRIRERLSETVVATQGAIEAAHERKRTSGGSVAVEVDRLSNLMKTMDDLKSEIMVLKSSPDQGHSQSIKIPKLNDRITE